MRVTGCGGIGWALAAKRLDKRTRGMRSTGRMFPEPFQLGPVPIAPYGVAIAAGLLIAMHLARRENDRTFFLSPQSFERVLFWTVVWGFLVSRAFYVWTQRDYFVAMCVAPESLMGEGAEPDCLSALKVWEGGLVYYGGPIGSLVYLAWRFFGSRADLPADERDAGARLNRLLRFTDICAPSLALAHAFGRIGCVLAGCCFGLPWAHHLAITYPPESEAYVLGGGGRYPVPLMEAGFEACLFLLLVWLRPRKRRHGDLSLVYLLAYPAARSLLEVLRGDHIRGFLAELPVPFLNRLLGLPEHTPTLLTTSQAISVVVVFLALLVLWARRRRAPTRPAS